MLETIPYHSHPATRQDEWVISKSRNKRGTYLEIGAYDGVRHSNTKTLELLGWQGLLVECNPDIMPALRENRGSEQVRELAIVDFFPGDGRMFFKGGQYSGFVDRLPDDWLREHTIRGNSTVQLWNCITLDNFYHNYWKWGSIDYLSLDTEGGELEILKSFRHLFVVELMTVEFRYDRGLLDEICEAVSLTHELDEVRGFDACFVKRDPLDPEVCEHLQALRAQDIREGKVDYRHSS